MHKCTFCNAALPPWKKNRRICKACGHVYGRCFVCKAPLIEPTGCAGSGLCGPCCTGDASTAGEY
jgi:hypothetical protein